jgi:hypothetical protein
MRINEHRAKTLRDATANGKRLFYLFDFLSLPCQLPHPPHPPPQPPPPQPLDPHPPPPQPPASPPEEEAALGKIVFMYGKYTTGSTDSP